MKRFLRVVGLLVGAVIVLPPLWYVVFPADPPPDLPPAESASTSGPALR